MGEGIKCKNHLKSLEFFSHLAASASVVTFVIFKSPNPLVTNPSPHGTISRASPLPYTGGHDMISINSRFLNIHIPVIHD